MATTLANLFGDLSDMTDQDFTSGVALVRIRANTTSVVDPDHDKIRVLEATWQAAEIDGTFAFRNLIAGADTVVAGTLQYTVDIKIKGSTDPISSFGPFVLVAGDQNITDLSVVPAVEFNTSAPILVDGDVLTAAEAYTDSSVSAHVADPNAHPQYAKFQTVAGGTVSLPIILAKVGDQFPPVTQGAILFYGGV